MWLILFITAITRLDNIYNEPQSLCHSETGLILYDVATSPLMKQLQ